MNRSFKFTHAICRKPSNSIIEGLRAVDVGNPDLSIFQHHHADYVAALRSTGADVLVLEADEDFPDSVFVEDAALCLPEGVVIMRPGAPTRLGEAQAIKPVFNKFYDEVLEIKGSGFIEGGDILVTEKEILVGTSARTTSDGIEELRALTSRWHYKVREVHTSKQTVRCLMRKPFYQPSNFLRLVALMAIKLFTWRKVKRHAPIPFGLMSLS